MKYIKLIPVICISLLIASCGKTSKQGKMIPKDAAIIIHLDTKSLSSKLSWDEIKQTAWYKKIQSDTSFPVWVKPFLEDPEKTGADTKSELIFFYTKSGSSKFYIEGNLKDSKAFESFNKYFDPAASATKDGDVNLMKLKDKCVVGWKDDKFVYVFTAPEIGPQFDHSGDSSQKFSPAIPAGDLLAACKNIFSLKEDSSLYKNERFASLLESGDIHFWSNYGKLYSNNSLGSGMMGMLKLDKLFQDNYSAVTINFDNGKINVSQKGYYNKELSDILKNYSGGSLNTDMVKSLPGNVNGVFAFHLPPQELVDIIKFIGIDGFLNLMLVQQGLNLDQIAKASNGDMVFSLSDLSIHKDTALANRPDTGSTMEHGDLFPAKATILFATGIGDRDVLNKILNAIKNLGKEMGDKISKSYKMNEKYFVASNSPEAMDNFLAGGKNNPPYLDKIKGNTYGGFIDIQGIIKAFQPRLDSKDSVSTVMYNLNLKTWDNIYITAEGYSSGHTEGHIEVNFMDKNTNSLKQMNSFMDQVSQVAMEEKKRKDEERSETKLDTVINKKGLKPDTELHKKTPHK